MEHIPVLLRETINCLRLGAGMRVVDCTLGLGGHTRELLWHIIPGGKILALDTDESAIAVAKEMLVNHVKNIIFVHDNFANLDVVLRENNFSPVDAILMDLGISSFQLDDPLRGFSFLSHGPLDMRVDQTARLTAAEIVNTWSYEELVTILRQYADERFAKRIVRGIIEAREQKSLESTTDLADIVKRAVPRRFWPQKRHVATRTFMALRIAVNREFENLDAGLHAAFTHLKPNGRIAVITFHSSEDRMVKRIFKEAAIDCICPIDMPVCRCEHRALIKIITKKPIVASDEELRVNPRARSAKLRVAQAIIS